LAAKKQESVYTPPQHIDCAFAGCSTSAVLREKTSTGWANLCGHHAITVRTRAAEEFCKSLGLNTVEEKRKWLKSNKLTMKRIPVSNESPL
jgi:hypothetical protein